VLVTSASRFRDNYSGDTAAPTLASAATLTLSPLSDFVEITGTTQITSITASFVGRRITLRFSNASPGGIADGNNLKLAGNFAATTDDTISLVCDGTNWYETGRSGDI
jgi:hypothetical protein